jgi:hypothetical protein
MKQYIIRCKDIEGIVADEMPSNLPGETLVAIGINTKSYLYNLPPIGKSQYIGILVTIQHAMTSPDIIEITIDDDYEIHIRLIGAAK